MFFFQKDYFRHARGQHLKIFFFGILMMLAAMIAILVVPGLLFAIGGISAANEKGGISVLLILLGVLILLASVVLIMMPLQYSIYAYYMYGYKERDVKFSDGLFLFKKGRYWKTVGLVILVLIMSMVASSILSGIFYAIGFGITSIFGVGMQEYVFNDVETMNPAAMIPFIIVQAIIAILQILTSIFIAIAVGMIMLNHLDQPQNTLGEKFSKGLSIAFKSFRDLVKLFVSNALLNLLPVVIFLIFGAIIGVMAMNNNEIPVVALTVLLPIFVILTLIASTFVSYIQTGSFISYYFKGRDLYETEESLPGDDINRDD